MRRRGTIGSAALPILVLLTALASACSKSDSTPTSPEGTNASLTGTVIAGVGPGGLRAQASPVGLAGVTVKVMQTGASAVTDASGTFTISRVPTGPVDLSFERPDVHAQGNVTVPSAAPLQVTVSIVGNKAVISPRGHAGAEIEGLVTSVDAAGSSLVVSDERLGSVTVHVTATTIIRHGQTPVALASIAAGNRVHVKAMQGSDGTYTATDVNIQSQGAGGDSKEVTGTVASVDAAAKTFVVTTSSGPVTVTTDPSTTFKKNGAAATFADVATGATVDVEGTTQSPGVFLAKEVEIEA
jgi:hypothetical protein